MSDVEQRVTELLEELARATPVGERPRVAAERPTRPDEARHEYPVRSLARGRRRRRSRRPAVVAVAAVLVVAVVVGALVLVRDGGSPVSVSAAALQVDTAALGSGRMAVVIENDLYVADGPSGAVWKLTDVGTGEEVSNVSFSHDGEWVAFMLSDDLWTLRWDGTEAKNLGASSSMAWSPTDDVVAYVADHRVRVARAGGQPRSDPRTGPRGFGAAEATLLTWSPDGSTVAYGTDVMGAHFVTTVDADDPALTPTAGGGPPFLEQALAWPVADRLLAVERSADMQQTFVSEVDFRVGLGAPDSQPRYAWVDPTVVAQLAPWDQGLSNAASMLGTSVVAVDPGGVTVAVASPDGPTLLLCPLATATCSQVDLGAFGRLWVLGPAFSGRGSMVSVIAEQSSTAQVVVVGTDGAVVDTLDLGERFALPASDEPGPDGFVANDLPQWGDGDWLLARVDHDRVVRWTPGGGEPQVVVRGAEGRANRSDEPAPSDRLAYWAPA